MSYTCLLKGPELDFVSNLLQTIPMAKINAMFTQTHKSSVAGTGTIF